MNGFFRRSKIRGSLFRDRTIISFYVSQSASGKKIYKFLF